MRWPVLVCNSGRHAERDVERGRSGEAEFTEATRAASAAAHAQRDGFVYQEEAVQGGTAHGALFVTAQRVGRRASRGVCMRRRYLPSSQALTSQSLDSPNNRTAGAPTRRLAHAAGRPLSLVVNELPGTLAAQVAVAAGHAHCRHQHGGQVQDVGLAQPWQQPKGTRQ